MFLQSGQALACAVPAWLCLPWWEYSGADCGRFSRNETPVGRLLAFAPGDIQTRIRLTTKRPSLLPTSLTRTSVSLPRGLLTPIGGDIRGYQVPRKYRNDSLGPALTPEAQYLRWETL